MRKTALVAAEQNHLSPCSVASPSPSGRASVSFVRHVGAALPLGHRHPAKRAVRDGERREEGLPLGGERRVDAKRGNRGMRHRERAADTGFDLPERHERRGARNVRAGARITPGRRVHAVAHAELEQRVPCGMKLDVVDPVAEAVVGAQHGRVLVRKPAPLERLTSELVAEREQRVLGPVGTLALNALEQRPVLPRRGCSHGAAEAGFVTRTAIDAV